MKLKATLLAGAIALVGGTIAAQATGFADYYVIMTAPGVVTKGVGVVSGSKTATGTYQIKFARPLQACIYIATIRGNLPGMIAAGQKGGVNDTAIVTTFSKTGVKTDMQFNLLVQCNS